MKKTTKNYVTKLACMAFVTSKYYSLHSPNHINDKYIDGRSASITAYYAKLVFSSLFC